MCRVTGVLVEIIQESQPLDGNSESNLDGLIEKVNDFLQQRVDAYVVSLIDLSLSHIIIDRSILYTVTITYTMVNPDSDFSEWKTNIPTIFK